MKKTIELSGEQAVSALIHYLLEKEILSQAERDKMVGKVELKVRDDWFHSKYTFTITYQVSE
jgi:hypothetical protein